MIAKVTAILEEMDIPKEKAKQIAEETIPKLGRWKRDPTNYI